MNIQQLIEQVKPAQMKRVAVAAPEDPVVLRTLVSALKMGIAFPVLCGDAAALVKMAKSEGIDISDFEVVDVPAAQSAKTAVKLVHDGQADILMKGLLQTADLLREVLNPEYGLRAGGKGQTLSHVSVFYSPVLQRTMLLTDAGMVTYPDLKTKVQMIDNAVKAAKGIGIKNPKVACIAPIEVVNPAMQSTVDASLLANMSRRGQIKDCVVDGPLAMDVAISLDAVEHKGLESEVAGKADILLMHNIDVANSVIKAFVIGGNCILGGIVMGASAPIALTSRSNNEDSKLFSLACAASICAAK